MCLFYKPWIVAINIKSCYLRTKLFPAEFITCLLQSSKDYFELSSVCVACAFHTFFYYCGYRDHLARVWLHIFANVVLNHITLSTKTGYMYIHCYVCVSLLGVLQLFRFFRLSERGSALIFLPGLLLW